MLSFLNGYYFSFIALVMASTIPCGRQRQRGRESKSERERERDKQKNTQRIQKQEDRHTFFLSLIQEIFIENLLCA